MQRVSVISSNVAGVGYDEHSRTLEVEFQDGHIYQYRDVPAHHFDALTSGASVGRYLNTYIKGNYPYLRVS